MPSTAEILAVRDDQDLRQRIEALAALDPDPQINQNPSTWVQNHIFQIANAKVSGDNDTVASVLAYAIDTYKPTPRPGANLGAVTDDHIRAALQAVKAQVDPRPETSA